MALELRYDSDASVVDCDKTDGRLRGNLECTSRVHHTVSAAQSLRYQTIPVARHDENLRREWDAIRSASPALRSPFFSHQFIEAVESVCGRMETAIAFEGNSLFAILPFHRRRRHHAGPVGAGINDAHALLVRPEAQINFEDFLEQSNLKSFAFHASPPDAVGIGEFEIGRAKSFLADLTVDSLGYEHFLRSTSDTIDRQGQKTRRLERQHGKLRLEYDCRDSKLIEYLVELKGAQYRRTHTFNILGVDCFPTSTQIAINRAGDFARRFGSSREQFFRIISAVQLLGSCDKNVQNYSALTAFTMSRIAC